MFTSIAAKLFARSNAVCGEKRPRNSIHVVGSSGSSYNPDGSYKIYKTMSLYGAIPLVVLLSVYNFVFEEEKERMPFMPYEHLRRRTKRFPWGDGNKTLFHNPDKNALPDGYEDGDNNLPQECQERLERLQAGEDPDKIVLVKEKEGRVKENLERSKEEH